MHVSQGVPGLNAREHDRKTMYRNAALQCASFGHLFQLMMLTSEQKLYQRRLVLASVRSLTKLQA